MPSVEAVWSSSALPARVARGLLLPLSAIFRVAAAGRSALYAMRVLSVRRAGIPVISVGNLTVGGTGKTPVASWLAGEVLGRGTRAGIVLRGYGGDEVLVHRRLSPAAIVVADPDRVRGALSAATAGARCVVLDDGFQHRRLARDADVVLLSADAIDQPRWTLPAGPWREPASALRRASLILVTRKAAGAGQVARAMKLAAREAPIVPVTVASLAAETVHRWDGEGEEPLATLRGARVLAVSAIGDPGAFGAQLRASGLQVETLAYSDHHAYSAADAASIVARAGAGSRIVCTLKDAVKLGPVWPHGAPPLWYLSQRVVLEQGAEHLDRLLDRVLAGERPGAG